MKHSELDRISEQIDKMASVRATSNDKIHAYQHKILQLLLQEKTTRLMNESLSQELTQLSSQKQKLENRVAFLDSKLQNETERFQAAEASNSSKLEETSREMGLAKMKWLDLEEKNEELQAEIDSLRVNLQEKERDNKRLKETVEAYKRECQEYQNQTGSLSQQSEGLSKALAEAVSRAEQCQDRIVLLEKDLSFKQMEEGTLRNQTQSLSAERDLLLQKNTQQSAALERNKALATQSQQTLHHLQQDYDLQSEKLKGLERENALLKDRKKQMEDELSRCELERETMTGNFKRLQKDLRKVKEELKESESRVQELEEEIAAATQKIKNLDKGLKRSKKEVEELKEALISAEETSGSEATRIKKYQATARSQRERISQLQQQLSSKQEQISSLKTQFESSEKARFEVIFQLEKTAKEKQVLSELNLQLEERRVLLEGEREKAVSQLVREKDVFSRANFKLLQILEFKENVIRSILKAIEGNEQKVQLPATSLGAERELQELLSVPAREKLLSARQRSKFLSEWLGRK